MKSKLILFYSMFLDTYYYNQQNDERTSREYAYIAVRNILGVVIYMTSIVILSIITCVFEFKIFLLDRLTLLAITCLFLCAYLLFAKNKLKPLFNNIELKKERSEKKYFFVIAVVLTGLFCGGMYALGKILTIYLCS